MSTQPDVIVVGAGVVGAAVAYELARRSVDLLLIDTHLPGRATSASAGGLWPVGEAVGLGCGVIYHSAAGTRTDGPEPLPDRFREFLVESNLRFPQLQQQLTGLSGIDIELTTGCGLMFLMYSERERLIVDRIANSLPDET